MKTQVNFNGVVVPKTDTSAAGGAATITLAAAEDARHVLDSVFGGYDADPTSGALEVTVTVNGTAVTLTVPITEDMPFSHNFSPPIQGDLNTAMVIALAAGGGAVVANVNALTR